ncbi:MAG TPA: hypothetical protein VF043_34265 [Ktedonobacteraceae bacterium]
MRVLPLASRADCAANQLKRPAASARAAKETFGNHLDALHALWYHRANH